MELGLHTNRHRGFSSRPHGARAILWRAPGVYLAAFCDLARLPVFALPPAESLRILMGPDASHTQNSIAAVSAEAARQRCGNATVPACFPWTIGALFDRPKREEPSEFCRVFGPWTAGAGTTFFIVAPPAMAKPTAILRRQRTVQIRVHRAG